MFSICVYLHWWWPSFFILKLFAVFCRITRKKTKAFRKKKTKHFPLLTIVLRHVATSSTRRSPIVVMLMFCSLPITCFSCCVRGHFRSHCILIKMCLFIYLFYLFIIDIQQRIAASYRNHLKLCINIHIQFHSKENKKIKKWKKI